MLERGMTEHVPLDNIKDRHLTQDVFQDSDSRSMFHRNGFTDPAAHAASSHSSSPLVRWLTKR